MCGQRRGAKWAWGLILLSLPGMAADRASWAPAPLGWIVGGQAVWVNNQPVAPRTTVFQGDVVRTGKGAAAVMSLGAGTKVTLGEESEVALPWEQTRPSLNLRQGAVVIGSASRPPARVSVLGTDVLVVGQPGFPALCRIAAVGRSAAVFADRGRVEIHGAGAPLLLPPGKYAQLEAGQAPGAAGQQAGKVAAGIPAYKGERQGQELRLKLADPLHWQDVVITEKTGRVRIELLDGSFLNVGARSRMTITRHDPQSQQTDIEFTLGRMRGEVVKLTKPGSSFQVRTRTAVIGVVGTVFLIQALANVTRVRCLEGLLTVQNINPAVAGQVSLGAGQSTSVPAGAPPAAPVQTPPAQVQSEMAQTNVPSPAAPGAAPGAPGGPAAPAPAPAAAVSTTTSAASTAASGTSAALSGATVVSVNDATSTLTTASTTLTTATTSTASAITAANNAAIAATNVNTAAQEVVQQLASPSQPCGCQ